MASHIRQPGFQLLSITDSTEGIGEQMTYADTPCHLPNQFRVLGYFYQPCLVLTCLILFISNWYRSKHPSSMTFEDLPLSHSESVSRSPSPLPTEPSIWVNHTSPVSPLGTLPTTIRTPNPLSGPTQRTASRPGTPLLSPLLTPMAYHQEEDDDDDSMYPAQYAIRRTSFHENEWSPERQTDFLLGTPGPNSRRSYFLAGHNPPKNYLFSYAFAFGGQRRRITIHSPSFSWTAIGNFLSLFEEPNLSFSSRRRGLLRSTISDTLRVLLPIILIWGFLTWWTY